MVPDLPLLAIFLRSHDVMERRRRARQPFYATEIQYLKVFVRRLRNKLGDDAENPRYIQTEWGIGYRFAAA